MGLRIIVTKADLATIGCDAVVNPANSLGLMGGGVALALKEKGGEVIEAQAKKKAPIPIGKAVSTAAGSLPCGFVIHAPTMEHPAEKIPKENVEKATYAGLEAGNRLGAKSMAFPGMGTGVGGVKKDEAAEHMVKAIKRFEKDKETVNDLRLEKVILVAYDDELFEAFLKWTKESRQAAR